MTENLEEKTEIFDEDEKSFFEFHLSSIHGAFYLSKSGKIPFGGLGVNDEEENKSYLDKIISAYQKAYGQKLKYEKKGNLYFLEIEK